jgi:hypothetical protein
MADAWKVTWEQASARRLERNGLIEPFAAGTAMTDAVAAMHGTHAQALSVAEISVALRIQDATRADVQKALWSEDRSLVKTFGPRGTVHVLPAAIRPRCKGCPIRRPLREGARKRNDCAGSTQRGSVPPSRRGNRAGHPRKPQHPRLAPTPPGARP